MKVKTFGEIMYHQFLRHEVITTLKTLEYPYVLRTIRCRTCKILFYSKTFEDGLENYEI